MGPARLGCFGDPGACCSSLLRPTEAPGSTPRRVAMLLALLLTLRTLVGKSEGHSGPASGDGGGGCQEQMRPVCLFRPVSCLCWSSRPPLSARGDKGAPWEPAQGAVRGCVSHRPHRSLPAPASSSSTLKCTGGLNVLLIELKARRSGSVGKRQDWESDALHLALSPHRPSCRLAPGAPNLWEPHFLRLNTGGGCRQTPEAVAPGSGPSVQVEGPEEVGGLVLLQQL